MRLVPIRPSLHAQDYPEDLKEKVAENVRNNKHPLDTSGQKGAISVFVGNLPFSVSICIIPTHTYTPGLASHSSTD